MKKITLKTCKCASVAFQERDLEDHQCPFVAYIGLYNDFMINRNNLLFLQYPIKLTFLFCLTQFKHLPNERSEFREKPSKERLPN